MYQVFHNWSDEDLKCKWDNKPYTFEAGKSYVGSVFSGDGVTILALEPGNVFKFSHDLAVREMEKAGFKPGREDKYIEFKGKSIGTQETIEIDVPKTPDEPKPKKKPAAKKKAVKAAKPVAEDVAEEEFEDIK